MDNLENRNSSNSQDNVAEDPPIDYRAKYLELKKQLKELIRENEFLWRKLRQMERHLLQITKDRNFLLDCLEAHVQRTSSPITSSSSET